MIPQIQACWKRKRTLAKLTERASKQRLGVVILRHLHGLPSGRQGEMIRLHLRREGVAAPRADEWMALWGAKEFLLGNRPAAGNSDGGVVRGQVTENVENILRIGLQLAGNFGCCLPRATSQALLDVALELEHSCRGFFPSLDSGLMIRIDVYQGGIKADRPLIEGNQRADPKGVHFRDRDGDRLAAIFVKGGASPRRNP